MRTLSRNLMPTAVTLHAVITLMDHMAHKPPSIPTTLTAVVIMAWAWVISTQI